MHQSGSLSPLESAFFFGLAIVLPIVIIGFALLFSGAIKKFNTNPKAFKLAGWVMGAFYLVLFVDGIVRHKNLLVVVASALSVIGWPWIGFRQSKAIESKAAHDKS